jgi:transcriptional regulator of met regulon
MLARHVSRTLVRHSKRMTVGLRHANVTRTLSAASVQKSAFVEEPAPESADLIRDCIKGLMEKQRDVESLKPITDAELQQRLQAFQVGPT